MLKLIQTDWGQFDLAYDANAVSDDAAAFATVVYAALLTDAEADATQTSDRYERRGWWANSALGSLIWWHRQQPLSPKVKLDCIANMLATLQNEPSLSAVAIVEMPSARNVSTLSVEISALYNGVKHILLFNALLPG